MNEQNIGKEMADCFDEIIKPKPIAEEQKKARGHETMDAKETIKYLYEHGHIPQTEHFRTIYGELDKPVTEHPDVQRLIGQVVELQAEIKRLKDLMENLLEDVRSGQTGKENMAYYEQQTLILGDKSNE